MRHSIVIALLLGATGAAGAAEAEDKDPIKEKLFAAKVAYDKEMRQFRKQVEEWFNKREETARQAGDKKTLDQLKEDRSVFEDSGELPKSAPTLLKQKHDRARKALDTAYAEAVKAYIKAKKDDQAAAVEEAWREFKEGGPVELLSYVDPKKHAVGGDWKKDGKALVLKGGDKHAILQLPYEPGEEYNLEVAFRRLEGDGGFYVVLNAGGQSALAIVDGWPMFGYMSGIHYLDGREASDDKNETKVKGQFLKSNTDYTLVCSVRKDAINLSLNGKEIVSYKGKFSRLSFDPEAPNKKALVFRIVPGTSFTINRIVVTPVKGKGTILR